MVEIQPGKSDITQSMPAKAMQKARTGNPAALQKRWRMV